jgi:hypothetical protein
VGAGLEFGFGSGFRFTGSSSRLVSYGLGETEPQLIRYTLHVRPGLRRRLEGLTPTSSRLENNDQSSPPGRCVVPTGDLRHHAAQGTVRVLIVRSQRVSDAITGGDFDSTSGTNLGDRQRFSASCKGGR